MTAPANIWHELPSVPLVSVPVLMPSEDLLAAYLDPSVTADEFEAMADAAHEGASQ